MCSNAARPPAGAPVPRALARAALAALLAVLGAGPAQASTDPGRRWFTLETEHFAVYSYEGGEAIARDVAAYAEEAWRLLNPLIGTTPSERVHVVVTDDVDGANGFASVQPRPSFTVQAYAPPADSELGDYASWLRLLVFHEYVHVLHLGHVGGLPELVNDAFGHVWYPNEALPRWATEGIAVWVESTATKGGRVGSSRFEMFIRSAALAGKLPSLGELTGYPLAQPRGSSWYLYGGYLMELMAREAGPGAIRRFIDVYGDRPVPFSVGLTTKEVSGKPLVAWWAQMQAEMTARARAVAARVAAAGPVIGEQLTHGGEYKVHATFSPDGGRVAWVQSTGHRPAHLVLAPASDPARATDVIRCEGGCGELTWTRDGRELVYATSRYHRVVSFYGALARVPARPGVPRRDAVVLSGARRAQFPAAGGRDGRVWYLTSAWGTTAIEAVDLTTGAVVARLDPPAPARLDGLAATADGRSLFTSAHMGGDRDLYRVDTASGAFERLTEGASIELDLALSPDERWLVYSSDADGVYDIYVRDLASGVTHRVTRVLGGAFDPAVSPDGQTLLYSGWTGDGLELFRLPFDPERAPVVATPDPRPLRGDEPPPPVTIRERPYQALPSMLPQRWLPTWVVDSTGFARLGLGFSGTDVSGRYAASLAVEWDIAREDVSAAASGTLSLGFPDLTLSAGRYSWDRYAFFGDALHDYREEVYYGALGVSLPFPSVFTSLNIGASFSFDLSRALEAEPVLHTPEENTAFIPREGPSTALNLWWSLGDVRSYTFSISPELGGSAYMNLRLRDPAIGSHATVYTLTWVGRAYLPMPLPDHALALRLEGGISGGDDAVRAAFTIGGVPDQDLLSDLLNQVTAGAVWLRGFPPGAYSATSYTLGSLEYRLPLWRVRDGLDTLPVFLQDLTLAAFSDAAWLGPVPFLHDGGDVVAVGIGAELRARLELFYGYGVDLRLGYARGLGGDGIDQVYLLMAPAP